MLSILDSVIVLRFPGPGNWSGLPSRQEILSSRPPSPEQRNLNPDFAALSVGVCTSIMHYMDDSKAIDKYLKNI